MTFKTYLQPLRVGTPLRRRSDQEVRRDLALDLSRGDWEKARQIMRLPLMDVAVDGSAVVRTKRKYVSPSAFRKTA